MILVFILFSVSVFLFILSFVLYMVDKNNKKYKIYCNYNVLSEQIVQWGIKNIPEVTGNQHVKLTVSIDEEKKRMASFCPVKKEIIIYIKNHDNVIEIIDSLLHEITHYKQFHRSPRGNYKSYLKLMKEYGYKKHPMEIEAVKTAKKYTKGCLNYLIEKNYVYIN